LPDVVPIGRRDHVPALGSPRRCSEWDCRALIRRRASE
jgi:hypothetical protein